MSRNICRGISSQPPSPEEALEWFGCCGQAMHLPAGEIMVAKYYNAGYQRLVVARSLKGLRSGISAVFAQEGAECRRTQFLRGYVAKLPERHAAMIALEEARSAMVQAWGDIRFELQQSNSPLLQPCKEETWFCTCPEGYECDAPGACEDCGEPLRKDESHFSCDSCVSGKVFIGEQTLWEITKNWMTAPGSRYVAPVWDKNRAEESLPEATHFITKYDGWGQWKPEIHRVLEEVGYNTDPAAFALHVISFEPPMELNLIEEELRASERASQAAYEEKMRKQWEAKKPYRSNLLSNLGVH